MDKKDAAKDKDPKQTDGGGLREHLESMKRETQIAKGLPPEPAKDKSPTPDPVKDKSPTHVADSTDSVEPEKYLLNPEPVKPQTVRKCLDELMKDKKTYLVLDSYELDDEKFLKALPDPDSAPSVILMPIHDHGNYFLFELQKSENKLNVYNSNRDKVSSDDQKERILELLKKKGFVKLEAFKQEVAQQETNSMDSGIFVVLYAYLSILKGAQGYKVANSETIRANLYDFLVNKKTDFLDQVVKQEKVPEKVQEIKQEIKQEKKTDYPDQVVKQEKVPEKVQEKVQVIKPGVNKKESTGFPTSPPPIVPVPKTIITGTMPSQPAKKALQGTPPAIRPGSPITPAWTPTPKTSNALAPFVKVPPSPTQSASSEGSFSYSLPGSPHTPSGLTKYRKYLKKFRKMAREDDEGVQYVWTKYKIDDEVVKKERRSFGENTRYPSRRGRRRMVLMEIDSEVTWDLMIRCKFCFDKFSRANDCKEHLINRHNLERN